MTAFHALLLWLIVIELFVWRLMSLTNGDASQ